MGLPAEKLPIPLLSIHAASVRYDPTRTLHLRNTWARDFRVRFAKLKQAIVRAVVAEDCFGLAPPDAGIRRIMVQEVALQTPGSEAFAFTRSADKVDKFMEWIHAQVDRGILEVSERPQIGQAVEGQWQNLYIQDSYQRGVQRARYELAHAGYGVPSMEATGGVLSSMSLPFHMDRVGLLFTRTYGDLKGITQAMESQISRVLSQGMADGDGPRVLARKLIATIDGSGAGTLGIHDTLGRFIPAEQRADLIARTETIRAFHQATIQEYRNWGVEGVKVQAEWRTAGDGRVCPDCASMQGKEFTLAEIEGMIPKHPRCLVGDARISPVDILAASKRWYEGKVIVIGTAGGKHLTCTPNHPILTDRGWIAADLLNVGHNVVCGLPGNGNLSERGYHQNMPTPIKEIAEAFRSSAQMVSREVPGTPPDFHGDGVDGNVTVIWANRKLRDKGKAGYAQEAPQYHLMFGDVARAGLGSYRRLYLGFHRHYSASRGLVRRLYLTTLGFGRHLCPLPAFCFRLGTGGDTVLPENPVNYDTGHPEFKVKGIGRHPGMKALANLFFRNRNKVVVPQGQPGFKNNSLDNFVSYIETPGNTMDGFPGEIPLDDIVSLRRKFFRGHVYNLQTPKGYYIAEGIATHNCRCLALPVDMTGKEAAKQGPVAVPEAVPSESWTQGRLKTEFSDTINNVRVNKEVAGEYISEIGSQLAELKEVLPEHIWNNLNIESLIIDHPSDYLNAPWGRWLPIANILTITDTPSIMSIEKATLGGYKTVTPSVRSTLRHELGHTVHNQIDGNSAAWSKIYESKSPKTWSKLISEYGSGNDKELFAESFTYYTSKAYTPGTLPNKIEKYFDKLFKG